MRNPSFLSGEIASKAMELFVSHYTWDKPIRSIGVRGANLVTAERHIQLDLFEEDNTKYEALENMMDGIRKRFGHYSIQRCVMLQDQGLTGFNPKEDHVIHPVSFFK